MVTIFTRSRPSTFSLPPETFAIVAAKCHLFLDPEVFDGNPHVGLASGDRGFCERKYRVGRSGVGGDAGNLLVSRRRNDGIADRRRARRRKRCGVTQPLNENEGSISRAG